MLILQGDIQEQSLLFLLLYHFQQFPSFLLSIDFLLQPLQFFLVPHPDHPLPRIFFLILLVDATLQRIYNLHPFLVPALLLMPDLQLMIFPDPLNQLLLPVEIPLPAVLVLLQILQIMQDLDALLDPTDLVELIIFCLNEADLLTDKIDNVLMVIEEVLEIYLIIELYVGTLLEEQIVEDVYDGFEYSIEQGVY